MATTIARVTGDDCPRCTETGILLCAKCRSIKYCSKECQHADWATHKVLCGTFKHFQVRPSENMRRAICFDPATGRPRFMWTTFKKMVNEGYNSDDSDGETVPFYEYADFKPLMNRGSFCRGIPIEKNAWSSIDLGYAIKLYYDDNFSMHYSNVNEAVERATEGKNGFKWKGPLFAVCGAELTECRNLVEIADMDMKAYADVVAALTGYLDYSPQQLARKGPKIECVKAMRQGERGIGGAKGYQIVKVPASHPIFEGEGDVSAISELIGMPLHCMRYSSARTYALNEANFNQVSIMFCDINPNGENFGCFHVKWDLDIGDVLIANLATQQSDVDSIDAFGDFCEHHFAAYISWAREFEGPYLGFRSSGPSEYKRVCLDQLTPENWATYLKQWKEMKAQSSTGPGTAHMRSFNPFSESGIEELSKDLDRMALTKYDGERLAHKLLHDTVAENKTAGQK